MAPNKEKTRTGSHGAEPSVLQRTKSEVSLQIAMFDKEPKQKQAAAVAEVEDGKCECCGMSEECTPGYIRKVRGKFSGNMICGLCAEAVTEEMEKNGGKREDAVSKHMNACARFNRIGRTCPVLLQAEGMRELLKKKKKSLIGLGGDGDKSGFQRKGGGIQRSSSCIPAMTRGITDLKLVNQ
ncbi:uncharacterized protein LOC127813506 [Diospyros lotus]|uniref:uncharacterized protein LOC127813506 n=1 Tax=Diospyros lotus TaxID=55363 RepID=UPI00225212EB|nr:uncharacterized protein LOC127813506 [Diospyros lotus]